MAHVYWLVCLINKGKENEVLAMENGGNKKVNAIYEAKLHDTSVKPNHHASGQVRERYVHRSTPMGVHSLTLESFTYEFYTHCIFICIFTLIILFHQIYPRQV